jgi:uncharacterized membrane-anchored protein
MCIAIEAPTNDVEALMFVSGDSYLSMHYMDVGHVSLDSWNQSNAEQLLQLLNQNLACAKDPSGRKIENVKWIQSPTFEHSTNTIRWTTENRQGTQQFVMSSALRFGRSGLEYFIWKTDRNFFTPFNNLMDSALAAHSFSPGYRYEDYRDGDKKSTFDIAAVVANTVTCKIVDSVSFCSPFTRFTTFIRNVAQEFLLLITAALGFFTA